MLPLLRYTLDLFSTEPQAASPAAPKPKVEPKPPAEKPAFVPGLPLTGAIDPAHFSHPQANREIRLADAVVRYSFSRAKRKTIGFVIGPEGLVVRAPRWTPLYEVDAALKEKGNWILRKLEESRERQSRAHSARVEWCDGVVIPYLGGSIRVLLDPTHGFSGKGAQLKTDEADQQVLHVGLPKSATADQIRDAVQAWLMRQALSHFKGRMDHFTPLLGVHWKKLRLSNAGTRWGSASADGSIRLNWRLIHFREPVIDYVVAHELSHLRVMDHSPRFWGTVATVVPDYPALRGELRECPAPLWE